MIVAEIILLVSVYLLVRMLPDRKYVLALLAVAGGVQTIVAILQYTGPFQSNHPFFSVTGFFGNPGQMGGFQSVALVATLLLVKTVGKKVWKAVGVIAFALMALSVVLSDSRASLLASLCGVIVIYRHDISGLFGRRKWMSVPALLLSAGLLVALYFYRTESADARMLIWRVSADMIADCLWFGHGSGGFMREYMLYQAEYFRSRPDSAFLMVADNAAYAYNEVILLLVNYGIVGFTFVVAVTIYIFMATGSVASFAPFVVLLVFSMFSYPGDNLVLLILFPICAGIGGKELAFHTPLCKLITGTVVFGFAAVAFFQLSADKMQNRQYEVDCYEGQITDDVIPKLRPTCENWCRIGDYYFDTENYLKAEEYYRTSSLMIPTRIRPSYSLWKLYLKEGRMHDAENMARTVLTQPVKVVNTYVLRCRVDVKVWLDSLYQGGELYGE